MLKQNTGSYSLDKMQTDIVPSLVQNPKIKFCQWLNAMIAQDICTVSFEYNKETYIADRISYHDNNFYVVTFKDHLGMSSKVFRIQFTDFTVNGPSGQKR